jgi:hypothetical protein
MIHSAVRSRTIGRNHEELSDDLDVVKCGVSNQLGDENAVVAQNLFHSLGSAVAAAQPDDLGWRSEKATALHEVAVLSNDAKIIRPRIFPDVVIGRLVEGRGSDVRGLREEVGEASRQPIAEILVEEKSHAAEPTR